MIVVIKNKSKEKCFAKSKRIISSILPQIDIRLNIGDIPERILIQLIKDLRKTASRGTKIKIFIKKDGGFSGFYLYEIGKKDKYLHNYPPYFHQDLKR